MALVRQMTAAFKQISLGTQKHITKPFLIPQFQQKCHRWSDDPKMVKPLGGAERIPVGLKRSNREFQAQSPFKPEFAKHRHGYEPKHYTGGLLPRHKKLKDVSIKGGVYNVRKAYRWSRRLAQKGQNDYIDILGDGNIHPYELNKGPEWIKGFRGNELQRIVRQFEFSEGYLRDMKPMELHLMNKRLFFLYKKMNKRMPIAHMKKRPEKFADDLPHEMVSRFEKHYTRRE